MKTKTIQQDLTGRQFERWTVTGPCAEQEDGGRRWLCRCSCGTERYVLERSLLYGGSRSCGCLRLENSGRKPRHDLTGRTFGDLTVVGRSKEKQRYGDLLWECRCTCGTLCDVSISELLRGIKTNCGCKNVRKSNTMDISGRKYGFLTVLYPTEMRRHGYVVWHCRCDCGNEVDVSYNELLYCSVVSCGCRKKEHEANLFRSLTHIDGTSLEAIRSKKIPIDNTTGYKGVYRIREKYIAKIVFQKKQYYLGTYETAEEAAEMRRQAEETLFDQMAVYYERYRQYADRFPNWEKEHPIHARVIRHEKAVSIELTPKLD